jgi:serine/threonine protein kinase
MEAPQIQGYQIQAEIGSGSAGVVYLATRDNGSRCAIKAFDSMSSNPGLLADRIQRILEAGAQGAIVPITAQALDARPACIIMDLLTGSAPDESPIESNTLQIAFNQYLKSDSTWPFLQNLASALAKLHSARVAHGNLKPGNIFLGQGGLPLLADFASGLMPGVHCANYSDALLYSPPEQLRSPQDYEGEAGYRWDVYAFWCSCLSLADRKLSTLK